MISAALELMGYFERSLGGKVEESPYGLGKRMCEVTVREYDRCLMGGDVSHPAVRDRIVFKGAFDLKEEIGHFLLLPLPRGDREGEADHSPERFGPEQCLWQYDLCDPCTFQAQCYLAGNHQLEGKAKTGQLPQLLGAFVPHGGGGCQRKLGGRIPQGSSRKRSGTVLKEDWKYKDRKDIYG